MCFVIALYCGGRVLYSLHRGVSKVYVTELFFFFLLFFSYQHCTPLNFFLAILKCRKVNTYSTCGKNAFLLTDYENDFSRLHIHRYWPFRCEFTVILYYWHYLWIFFRLRGFSVVSLLKVMSLIVILTGLLETSYTCTSSCCSTVISSFSGSVSHSSSIAAAGMGIAFWHFKMYLTPSENWRGLKLLPPK